MRMSSIALSAALACFGATAVRAQVLLGEVVGTEFGHHVGLSIDGAGDVDGDGHDDWVFGAPGDHAHGPSTGAVTVVSGLDGSTLHHFVGDSGAHFLGTAVAGVGDLDGDGHADVAAGATVFYGPLPGYVRAYSGATGAVLFTVNGDQIFSDFGRSLAALDDVDGDGVPDLAVGAPFQRIGDIEVGSVTVLSGADGAKLYERFGNHQYDAFGLAVAGFADVDHDGRGELLVGAPGAAADHGRVSLYSGAGGVHLHSFAGFAVEDALGYSVAAAGDVDGDGLIDIAVGAPSVGGYDGPGGAYVLSASDGSTLHAWLGTIDGSLFGHSISGPGDVNGDGFADVLVGAPAHDEDANTAGREGRMFLFSGFDGSTLLAYGPEADQEAELGYSVAGAGDVDGDGRPDLAVGARTDNSAGQNHGAARVVALLDPELGTPLCFGDGSGTPCPCGNDAGAGRGCANSDGPGARLYAQGSASVAVDDLELTAIDLPPNKPGLAFAGDIAIAGGAGTPFGDGLRCADVAVVRLEIRSANPLGVARYGPGLGTIGGWSAGEQRVLQLWYRDPSGPCGSGFNTSQAIELVFAP